MSLDMESLAALETEESPEYAVNPCKVCAPLGASLAFKGVEGAVPLLHGSQGCATYIRRYLISHFREPVDIASSSFDEMAAADLAQWQQQLAGSLPQGRGHVRTVGTQADVWVIWDEADTAGAQAHDSCPAGLSLSAHTRCLYLRIAL